MGLELVRVVRNNTIRIENLSPSHTVGLDQKDKDFVKVSHAFIKSPSHAVGLELRGIPKGIGQGVGSPSHAVGLEQSQKGEGLR